MGLFGDDERFNRLRCLRLGEIPASHHRPRLQFPGSQFETADGKAKFLPSPWPGLPQPVAAQKAKCRFYINQERLNEVWNTGYHNKYDPHVKDRYHMAVIELNPQDAKEVGVEPGDIVELYNDYGATYAMA